MNKPVAPMMSDQVKVQTQTKTRRPYIFSFRIRQVYFDQIVAGKKKNEVRKASKFWEARVMNSIGRKSVAVFVCGPKIHWRRVTGIIWYKTPQEALGRNPSAQGTKDIGKGPVYMFQLGRREKQP